MALQRTGEQVPQGPQLCKLRSGPQASQAGLTFTNILLPWAPGPGRVGEQYTDMDFRSRENSRVNSFRISCLMTCEARVGAGKEGRASNSHRFLSSLLAPSKASCSLQDGVYPPLTLAFEVSISLTSPGRARKVAIS